MKKFLCFTAIIAACLCGCSSRYDEDAISLYIDAAQAMRQIESIHIDVAGGVYGDKDKETKNTKINMNADLIISDQPQLAMEFDLAVYGVALDDTAFYLKDNTFYMNFMNEKTKVALPKDFMKLFSMTNDENGSFTSDDEVNAEAVKKMFKEFKYQDKDQGVIAFSFDMEMFDQLMKTAGANEQFKMTIKSYDGTMSIKDRMMNEITFDLLLEIEGKDYPISFTISFSEQNKVKEIKFPDFKDYKVKDLSDELDTDFIGGDNEILQGNTSLI